MEEDAEVEIEQNKVHKPNPKRFVKKVDCSHSFQGSMWGSIILMIAVTTLCLFFGLKTPNEEGEHDKESQVKFRENNIVDSSNDINDYKSMDANLNVRLC